MGNHGDLAHVFHFMYNQQQGFGQILAIPPIVGTAPKFQQYPDESGVKSQE